MAVESAPLRFSASYPCPICGGYEALPRGQGRRCSGYLSADGRYAHCSREELAAGIAVESGSTYPHRLDGPCRCGVTHASAASRNGTSHNGRQGEARAVLEHSYVYQTAHGETAFEVLRLRQPDGSKRFLQRYRERGEWVWRCPEGRRLLYRLPELLRSDREQPVWLVEGERAAEALRAAGLIATTAPMGAQAPWLSQYTAALRQRWVILWPDNDAPGREYMQRVATALAGQVKRLQLLDLGEQLPPKGDAVEWLAGGRSAAEIQALLSAAVDVPEQGAGAAGPTRPRIVKLAELQERGVPPISFVVQEILPEGVVLCGGRPKAGKSFLALNLAIAVAAGGKALGDLAVMQGDVLYLSLEGGEHGILPRANTMLAGARAPLALDVATEWRRIEEGGGDDLEEWLRTHPQARLVIIDTFQKVRSPSAGKKGIYEDDYAAFERLVELAARYRVTILVMHHTRKADAEDVFDTISGSTGMTGSVDGLWVLKRVRGADTATLAVTGRNLPEAELGLHWDDALLSWRHVGNGEEARRSSERREILRVLEADGGGPLTARNIADLLDLKDPQGYQRVRKLLWLMERSAELRHERGGYVIPI